MSTLLSKGMSIMYLKLLLRKGDVSKRFSKFIRLVFLLQLNFQKFCYNSKIRDLGAKLFVGFLLSLF